jgi:PAS domain S-box-containing protein
MIEFREKHKIPVILILLATAFLLTYYCHAVLRIEVLFTHFFYIPILLASIWWKRKGLIVAILLAGMLILTGVLLNLSIYENMVRGSMFIIIASIVAILSETNEKTANELKYSEMKYRGLFESSSDAIMLLDEKGFFDCNNAALNIFGYSNKEDFTKMHLSQVSPPFQPDGVDSGTATNKNIAEAFKNGTNHFEWIHRKNNGEDFTADVLLSALNFKAIQVLQATVRDITGRKRIEQNLRKNTQRTQALLDIFKAPHGTEEEIIAFAIEETITLTDSELGFIGFVDEHETSVQALLWSAKAMQACAIGNKPVQFPLKEGGIWAEAVKRHQNIIINDSSKPDPYKKGYPEGHVPLCRFIAIPLIRDGRAVLVCGMANKKVEYDENDILQIELFLEEVWDIISKLRAQEALRKSEEQFQSVTRTANDAIITSNSNGIIIFWNQGAQRIFGYSAGEIAGKPITFIMPERYHEPHKNAMDRVVSTGKASLSGQTVELSALRKDGSEFPIELSLSSWKTKEGIYFSGIIRDITQRNLAIEKLKKSKEFIETVMDSMNDVISVIDVNDFRIIDVNMSFLKLYGLKKEDVIGKTCYEITHNRTGPYVPPDDLCPLLETLETGKYATSEHVRYDQHGEKRYVEVSTSPIFDETGKAISVIHVVRDITERKRNEEMRLENMRLELESKAKSEFLASMSHELRTPLNAIIGFSNIMSLGIGGDLNETQKSYVNDIFNAGNHLLLIIDEILDLSRVEAGKMELLIEKFSVQELLEETNMLFKNKAKNHNIDININIDPQLEFMEGDKRKIKQVLLNLISNALKFSKEDGGTITIVVKKIDSMVSFSVSDTGIGIEEKNLKKLFNEFQQLDSSLSRKYGGTGLGLVITKKFVELHGGKITVESIFREGSTFTFTIPIQQKAN